MFALHHGVCRHLKYAMAVENSRAEQQQHSGAQYWFQQQFSSS
jgi:hypothetical protein